MLITRQSTVFDAQLQASEPGTKSSSSPALDVLHSSPNQFGNFTNDTVKKAHGTAQLMTNQ
jgi:hypothetical protein